MTDAAKHTPGILEVRGRKLVARTTTIGGRSTDLLITQTRQTELLGEAEANAERLKLCWNTHDRLVDWCKEALGEIRSLCDEYGERRDQHPLAYLRDGLESLLEEIHPPTPPTQQENTDDRE